MMPFPVRYYSFTQPSVRTRLCHRGMRSNSVALEMCLNRGFCSKLYLKFVKIYVVSQRKPAFTNLPNYFVIAFTEDPDVLAKVMMKKAYKMLDIDENEDPNVVKERIQEQLMEEAEKLGATISKGEYNI